MGKQYRWAIFLSLLIYGVVLVRTAWLADDAFITFRVVDNLVNGFGLRWNPSERVQAYTNPLWLFWVALCYFFSGEIFYTSLILSICTSLLVGLILTTRLATSPQLAALGIALLVSSAAFVDYSTSGLENPLTHLLLLLFLVVYLRQPHTPRTLLGLTLLAALGGLNRLDTLLLFAPPLGYVFWKVRCRRALAALALGFLPLLAWEFFSLFYYGFFFPNTAYAKLNTGMPAAALMARGIEYLLATLRADLLTLPVVVLGIGAALYRKNQQQLPIAVGLVLYLSYIVVIGGDFMRGRFLAAPFLVSVVLVLQNYSFRSARTWALACGGVLLVGLGSQSPPLLSGADYGKDAAIAAIADERAVYYPDASLLQALLAPPGTEFPTHSWAEPGRNLRKEVSAAAGNPPKGGTPGSNSFVVRVPITRIGYFGFYAGPQFDIIDRYALADALLARLPPCETPEWRAGHLSRIVPEGYLETKIQGQNLIADKDLALFYDKLSLITTGELFSWERSVEIWHMNLGHYDHLINYAAYRYASPDAK